MTKTILVIDDESQIVEICRDYLRAANFDVLTSGDGLSGLILARRHHPDLIVLDLMLPGMDGLDVCRALRREGNIPIIMLSAINVRFNLGFSDKDRDETWLPVLHFVEKPVVPDKLIKMVKDVIGS